MTIGKGHKHPNVPNTNQDKKWTQKYKSKILYENTVGKD